MNVVFTMILFLGSRAHLVCSVIHPPHSCLSAATGFPQVFIKLGNFEQMTCQTSKLPPLVAPDLLFHCKRKHSLNGRDQRDRCVVMVSISKWTDNSND